MSADTVTKIGGTIIQHGRLSDRIYVMHLSVDDLPDILDDLDALAGIEGYSKVFGKVPASALSRFLDRGYIIEAHVPRFFRGREDGYFVAKYLDPERQRERGDIVSILAAVREKAGTATSVDLPPGWTYAPASRDDAEDLAALYSTVFSTYPFPINDPDYLLGTMEEGDYRYFIVRAGDGRLAAASSAEIYREVENVEMTDFATHPECRGRNLAGYLLARMEEEMREAGMKMAFTIARGLSYPINATFARAGYAPGGTLTNNTNICGGFESMNVWYKPLDG